mgnify:FL=1
MKDAKNFVYEEIIDLQEHFHPVYLLDNEYPGQWKQFIPNEKFYTILNKVINTLNGEVSKKSFWIQGTYGVGKSHATSVMKHLLWDDINNIQDYLQNIEETSLRVKLENFRKNNKVIPIVIKGVSDITNNQTFKYVIQRNVKEQLKTLGININIDSDFETWEKQIYEEVINVNKLLNHPEIKLYVNSKEEILSKLKDKDINILETLEKVASELGISIFSKDIGEWLKDVFNSIKENGYANHLIIYWDEFTSVLDLENSSPILNELQKIAELSENFEIYLYLINHRKPLQSEIKKEDYEHVLDRFYVFEYTMNPVTSYHLLRAAIKVKNEEKFQELIEKYITFDVEKVIDIIVTQLNNHQIKNELKRIFPIHPYTGYILAFIARHIGSADRSIFTFLNDKEKGFKKFIKEHPKNEEDMFLTTDYLWDYFKDEFEMIEEYEKIGNILSVFGTNEYKFKEKNHKYLSVFKTILLLNILKNYGRDVKLISPTVENIKNVYSGVIKENEIDEILNFINNEKIIYKSPEDEFIIQPYTGYDPKELQELKESLIKQYNNSKSLVSLVENKIPLKNMLSSQLRKRPFELITIELSDIRESKLRENLDKFKIETPYKLKVIYFPILKSEDIFPLKKLLLEISKNYNDFIYIVGNTPFEGNEYDKFINYLALSGIYYKNKNYSESQKYIAYVEKIITNWLENHKTDNSIIFRGKEYTYNLEKLKEFEKEIFKYGLENINIENENLWKEKTPLKIIEIVLFSENLEDLISKLKTTPNASKDKQLLELFKIDKDYFVDNDFKKIKDSFKNHNHPVIEIYKDFHKEIEKEKHVFNLDEKIKNYKNIPFGYFPNEIHATVLSFLLRPFIGKLYNLEGKLLKKEDFRDFLEKSFKKWDKGFEFRVTFEAFGEEKEKFGEEKEKLVSLLSDIFSIEEEKDLDKILENIRKKINEDKIYLFLIDDNLQREFREFFEILKNPTSSITPQQIKNLVSILENSNLENSKEVLKKEINSKKGEEVLKNFIKENFEKHKSCELNDKDKFNIIETVYEGMKNENLFYVTKSNIETRIKDLITYTCKEKTIQEPSVDQVNKWEEKETIILEDNTNDNIDELIDNYNGNLKVLLKDIIDVFPEVKEWLKSKLRSEI